MRKAEKLFADALAASGTGYYHGKEHARKEAQKQESKRFNEFNTLAMQWAHSDKTQVGERTIRYRFDNAIIIEKTNDGFIEVREIKMGHKADISSVCKEIGEHNARLHETLHQSIDEYEYSGRNDSLYSRVDVGESRNDGRDGRVYQEQSERNGNGTYQQSIGNQSEIKESRRGYAGRNPSDVTEQEYNHHYWAVANDVLSTRESGALREAVGKINQGEYYPKTADGKYMVAVGENGVLNKIVFTDGGQESYSVEKVIKINLDNETDLDYERGNIYYAESIGVLSETSSTRIIEVYNGNDYAFDDFARKRSQNRRNSYVERDGRRSGAETENRTGNEVKYSLRGNGYVGRSMSVNAYNAYNREEMPLSKWTKTAIEDSISAINPDIDVSKVRLSVLQEEFLKYEGWHHTGEFYNVTDFYGINEEKVEKLTQSDVDELALQQPKTNQNKNAPQKNSDAIRLSEDTYEKISIIVDSGILKTENGVLKRVLSGKNIDSDYRKALETIKADNTNKVEQWRKLPPEHYLHNAVNLYDTDIEAFAKYVHPVKQLNKNSNIFKQLYNYYNGNSDIRYSLRDVDGEKVVVVDTDQSLFEGLNKNEYVEIAREYMKEKYRGQTIDGIKFTRRSENEYTFSDATQMLNKHEPETYKKKMRAVTELINFIKVGKFIAHEEAKHPKGFNVGGYNRYSVDFIVDGKRFNGELLVAIDANGMGIFYDIVNIKENGSTIGVYSEGMETVSNNSISQNSEKSTGDDKIKYSLRLTPAKSIENIVNWKMDRRSIIHDEREYYVSVPKASALFADKQSKQFLSQMMHMANDSSEPNRAKFADEFAREQYNIIRRYMHMRFCACPKEKRDCYRVYS